MFANLTGMHAVVILAIVFLLFGAAKLPALAKSVGQSVRILKKEVNEDAPRTVQGTVQGTAQNTVQGTAQNTAQNTAQDAMTVATVPVVPAAATAITAEPVVAAVPTAQQEQRIS